MKSKEKNQNNNFSDVNIKALGNYTKGAVESFENKIVEETNYLEKVDRELKKK